jgi:hypothetical protein
MTERKGRSQHAYQSYLGPSFRGEHVPCPEENPRRLCHRRFAFRSATGPPHRRLGARLGRVPTGEGEGRATAAIEDVVNRICRCRSVGLGGWNGAEAFGLCASSPRRDEPLVRGGQQPGLSRRPSEAAALPVGALRPPHLDGIGSGAPSFSPSIAACRSTAHRLVSSGSGRRGCGPPGTFSRRCGLPDVRNRDRTDRR